MAKNISEIPYTEAIERIQKLARIGADNMSKIRGVYNDIYVRDIPCKFDWNFLMASSSITVVDEYHQGSVTINTGATSVAFTSDAVLTASMVGYKIKFSGNPTVYDITVFNNTTSLTINPSLQGPINLSGASYSIYQPFYSLAQNFDRFPKPGGVYRWAGGSKQILPETQYAQYIDHDYQSTATTPEKTRLFGTDTTGNQLVELIPPPRKAAIFGYDYIRTLKPLTDSTAGTISSIGANATQVIGNTNTRFMESLTDGTYWFRCDALGVGQDSQWYKIIAIQHDSQLTIATAFANTAITTGAAYTISRSPEMPIRLHEGLIYGSLRALTTDQNDPNMAAYNNQYATVLSDAKRIYVSRPYSQEVTGVFEDFRYRR